MNGIPVTIRLSREEFLKLEKIAARKGVAMRSLIEAHIARSLQPKPDHKNHRSRATPKPGRTRAYVTLSAEQQSELVELVKLGWSGAELANRYGCSTATIDNWRGRLGVRRKDLQ